MNSYFEMPFRERARITITNEHLKDITSFFYTVNYAETDSLPENTLYFHAYWKRERQTELAKDYVILDKIKGKGYYVGTFLALTALERYWWGEGEFKFYLMEMKNSRPYPPQVLKIISEVRGHFIRKMSWEDLPLRTIPHCF